MVNVSQVELSKKDRTKKYYKEVSLASHIAIQWTRSKNAVSAGTMYKKYKL